MTDYQENVFEKELAEYLAAHGWLYNPTRPFDAGYDRERALYPADLFAWFEETQPEQWAKVVKAGASETEHRKAKDALLNRVVKQLDVPLESGGGTLNVLRGTVKDISARFEMCQFKPNTTLNPTTVERYGKVRCRVMRQVRYSTKNQNSIDLVLFINGVPVATLELKTDFTQDVQEAITQYLTARNPRDEPLLGFANRALVHFAVSNREVHMTTKLAGLSTRFLPFNMGDDGAAGNPLNPGGSQTAYLWERVLDRDTWLNIVGRLMHVERIDEVDPITGKKIKKVSLLFPRFHQWDVVTKMLAGAKKEGPGHRYLAQHSAGSGKTNSIAWLAHGLATLFDDANEKVFDSVIVVTDRTVLDQQLQEAIKQIEPRQGMVVQVTTEEALRILEPDAESKAKSALLAKALIDGRHIVVVTLQTFPFAMQAIRENKGLKGKKFAVIADEAHSSQAGSPSSKLKAVLTAEEQAGLKDGGEVDSEAVLAAEMTERAASTTISFFAFTATPKSKTLELFGRRNADGLPAAFHEYTMQQAIEEGFILDVLRNYTPYESVWKIASREGVKSEEEVDETRAAKALVRWVKLHPTNVAQKVEIIVEHFRTNVAALLDGHGKAMVVCDSRKAAVRYKNAFDRYIAKQGYDIQALVAFSGDDVPGMGPEDGPGPFNERTMNPGLKGRDIRTAFKAGDEYRVMLVANKFQTGFDEPLLCAMYVDKVLSGVTAVQTLSRLNRTFPGKDTTYILDFVKANPDQVLAAFKTYYRAAELTFTTDPNLVHDLQNKLDLVGIYTDEDVQAGSDVIIKSGGNNKLDAAIGPSVRRFRERWKHAVGTEDRAEKNLLELFRRDVDSFVRLYDFLSQIVDYGDTELERRSIYYRLLARRIQTTSDAAVIDLSDVELLRVRHKQGHALDMKLGIGEKLKPIAGLGTAVARDPRMGKLAEVIEKLNLLFGDEELAEDKQQSWVEAIVRAMLMNQRLVAQARANTPAQFLGSPDLKDAVTEVVMDNQTALNTMADVFYSNAKIRVEVIDLIGQLFHVWATVPEPSEKADG